MIIGGRISGAFGEYIHKAARARETNNFEGCILTVSLFEFSKFFIMGYECFIDVILEILLH